MTKNSDSTRGVLSDGAGSSHPDLRQTRQEDLGEVPIATKKDIRKRQNREVCMEI